jgi:hypothetical protein
MQHHTRYEVTASWMDSLLTRLSFYSIVLLAIYIDSMLFAFLATIFFLGVGLDDRSMHMCNGAAILCEDLLFDQSNKGIELMK